MSYYALFQGWLLLSQPPGCHCDLTSFPTEHRFGTLADGLGCFPFDDGAYPPPSDCWIIHHGIRSLMGFGKPVSPLALSVLYPRDSRSNASPQTISGRTSYLQVRLAFHPYPQLIQRFFNNDRFGPPRTFTCASPWPWIDHLVSGLLMQTYALFRLAFAAAPAHCLNHACTTELAGSFFNRHAISPALRHRPFTACKHTVSDSLSLPSRGSFHLSLTVLVHYRSSGHI